MQKELTICVIDWDDTCYPTTQLNSNPEPGILPYMPLLGCRLKRTFEHAIAMTDVVYIVTNAKLEWLKHCIKASFPSLFDTFESRVNLVSARDSFGGEESHDMCLTWKLKAFQSILDYHSESVTDLVRFLSFGDSPAEEYALKMLTMPSKSSADIVKINVNFPVSMDSRFIQGAWEAVESHFSLWCQSYENHDVFLSASR